MRPGQYVRRRGDPHDLTHDDREPDLLGVGSAIAGGERQRQSLPRLRAYANR